MKVLFLFTFLFSFSYLIDGKVIVETSSGDVEGNDRISRNGSKFVSFLGIPYGNITARFQTAKMASKSEGILKGDQYGPNCAQWNSQMEIIGEENCLSLNVFTPEGFKKSSRYPVMVFIHGGAFCFGGSSDGLGPEFLMNEKVVIVTINYRLHVLGFMNADDEEAPGNVGLKDQVLALEWVKKNIKKFGGSPSKVTIFGESAGSFSIIFLIVSPLARGLFHHAIAQSGSALASAALTQDHLTEFKIFADLSNCTKLDVKDTIKCLRELPLKTLMSNAVDNDFYAFRGLKTLPRQPFRPSIENCKKCQKFLPMAPEEIYRKGKFQKVNLMIGINKDEATIFALAGGYDKQEDIDKIFKSDNFDKSAPQIFYYKYTSDNPNEITKKVREFYFGGNSTIATSAQIHDLFNDRNFVMPSRKTAIMHSKYVRNTYLYNFDRPGEISNTKLGGGSARKDGKYDPTHADDLLYLFNSAQNQNETSKEFLDFSDKMVTLWTWFAKHGKPKTWQTTREKEWERVKHKGPISWFHLNENPQNIKEEKGFIKRAEFWDNLNV